MKRLLAFFLAFLSAVLGLPLFPALGYEVMRDVRYGEAPTAVMDVYFPREGVRRADGCVVMLHGGSYAGGDKREQELDCHFLAACGYVAVSINYTLYTEDGDYTVDTVLDEIGMAIAAVRDIATERGAPLRAVATAGYSAGGHLALLYAYTRREASPLPIRFAASLSGVASLDPAIWGDRAFRIGEILSGETLSRGDAASDAVLRSLSPAHLAAEGGVPTLIAVGERDTTVPPECGRALAAALSAAGIPNTLLSLSRSGHDMVFGNPIRRIGYSFELAAFCERYFE